MNQSQMKETLQEILEHPRNRSESELADILNKLSPEHFDEIVNQLLDQVSAADVKEFGIKHFNELDRYPNPHDGLLNREEIGECFCLAHNQQEKALLLWIWLAFDEIRQASSDFEGTDKIFDIVLTQKDFLEMKV